MKLYGLTTCDTCRKARKALPEHSYIDVRSDGVPQNVLAEAHQALGDALLNTRSTTWRGLDESERAKPVLDLLVAHPTLMKRPLIEKDGAYYLGWTKATQAALGLGDA